MLSLIIATGENGELGKSGHMPWHLPADLKHFKALTLGKPVIMGRKTYQSIGKPLDRRDDGPAAVVPWFCLVVDLWPRGLCAQGFGLPVPDHRAAKEPRSRR